MLLTFRQDGHTTGEVFLQLTQPGDVILVNVGVDRVLEMQPQIPHQPQVPLYSVPHRVYEDGLQSDAIIEKVRVCAGLPLEQLSELQRVHVRQPIDDDGHPC